MRDETCSDKFSNENRQVGSDGNHPVLQVIKKLATIFLNLDNLEKNKKVLGKREKQTQWASKYRIPD